MLLLPSRRKAVGGIQEYQSKSLELRRRGAISILHLTTLLIHSRSCHALRYSTTNKYRANNFFLGPPLCVIRNRMIPLTKVKLEKEIYSNKVSWLDKNGNNSNRIILANYRGKNKTKFGFYSNRWLWGRIQSCFTSAIRGAVGHGSQSAVIHGCQNESIWEFINKNNNLVLSSYSLCFPFFSKLKNPSHR